MTDELREQIDALGPGDHVCLLYETPEEQLAAVVPFLLRGMERGERCLYIVDDRTAAEVTAALRGAGTPVTAAVESGALEILTKRETYLRHGCFDPDAMLLLLTEADRNARDAGSPAFRGAGEMTWALGTEKGTDRLIEYEARLNDFVADHRAMVVCQYNRNRFPAATLRDVLRTHPIAILGDEVCPNPFYEEPAAVLEGASPEADVERMVTWMRRERGKERSWRGELERRVRERTAELAVTNEELETFAYSVSHDLRAPLRAVEGFSVALVEDHGDELGGAARDYLDRIVAGTRRMGELIEAILQLSRLMRTTLHRESVNLSGLAAEVVEELRSADPERRVEVEIAPELWCVADRKLLRTALENLLGNAWKFTEKTPDAHVTVGGVQRDGEQIFFIRDDGAGFDPDYADKLFAPFQRLHGPNEFEGTGIGLASVQRVVRRHGGRVWAEGEVGRGATFNFTLDGNRENPS